MFAPNRCGGQGVLNRGADESVADWEQSEENDRQSAHRASCRAAPFEE